MPFKSEKQRRYLWANEPEIARDWADTYGSRIQKNSGGITRIPFQGGGQDMSTVSAADLGIGKDTSKRAYTPAEQKQHDDTQQLNQEIAASAAGQEQTANTAAAIDIADARA